MSAFPRRAVHVHTYHPGTRHGRLQKRFKRSGPLGWCQLCEYDDTPADGKAYWYEGKERILISVCAEHLDDKRLTNPKEA